MLNILLQKRRKGDFFEGTLADCRELQDLNGHELVGLYEPALNLDAVSFLVHDGWLHHHLPIAGLAFFGPEVLVIEGLGVDNDIVVGWVLFLEAFLLLYPFQNFFR